MDGAVAEETEEYTPSDASYYCFFLKAQLIAGDRQERERQDSKNSLEEYIYDARNRASDETDLEPYLKPNDRQRLLSKLEEMENWLYEDGEDCQKSVYVQKIEDLRKLGDPPKDRKREYELRPKVIEELCAGLQKARKFVDSFASGDDKYSHIDAAEVQKLEKALQEKQIWLDQKMGAVTRLAKTDDIPAELRSSVFTAETQACFVPSLVGTVFMTYGYGHKCLLCEFCQIPMLPNVFWLPNIVTMLLVAE
ncbi:hypothetical protein QYM36_003971 [Artemia franciscana]|uniref:Uncharacterized protein n=1 Tax=Artemia franciscana TaxID=6661 RepID=A0AA88I8J3_ARTSF|nr:hypothetical protein QYM36_003971 [Artemia franciscana]